MASAKLEKKTEKSKKRQKEEAAAHDELMNGDASAKKKEKEKKDKKRKASEGDAGAAAGAAGADAAAPAAAAAAAAATPAAKKARKESGKKDAAKKDDKKESKDGSGSDGAAAAADGAPAKDPASLDNYPQLADSIKSLLRSKGIEALFPIQSACLDFALQGHDIVGRARTGCGKTLAFVLPIVQGLLAGGGAGKKAFGRKPAVVVLAPTRELAKQVHADFEYIGKSAGLITVCLYGGTQYGPQESLLRRGVDVVVGTPGRVKDHLERGTLDLSKLRFRVLDECDEMLNMGFVDDVEKILNAGINAKGADKDAGALLQTMLFSATMPTWVKDITRRFLRPGHKLVDLVGDSKIKAATTVRHLMLPAHWTQRAALVTDLVKCWGLGGRTIVFTETKNDANELSGTLSEIIGARALHGDIAQAQREATLAGFREGRFSVLVATDVAARGLDISGVELVIQVEPPKDPETYIHRSGRTGRAGRTGVCITLVGRKHEGLIPFIEKRAGFKFERVGAPQPSEMATIAADRALEMLRDVEKSVVPLFSAAAREWLAECATPEEALALAFAKITGHTAMRARSLLTAHEGVTTLLYRQGSREIRPGYVYNFLRRHLDEQTVEEVRRVTLTEDEKGAVFDVPSQHVEALIEKCGVEAAEEAPEAEGVRVLTTLPALKEREGGGSDFGGWGDGGGGGGGGGRGWGGRGGGGGGGRFGGGGGGRGGGARGGGRFSPGGGRSGGRGGRGRGRS
ncbi:DEAD-box ATP-dependent RNA helicase [Raphidocelis subcapitata]|uniref:RNA helicase n=1 Tax=Raphidocelis subcapitata TaxID=307507 RepID=A0A2V0PN25_9CHLO|nr:DEAD-box ATP-dependent RNA helicase [Raphidocelis subcapitata]|eukprot:GBF99463.1 DEAD-box ATP-dependent RNA helicase [Raphidocelis subcapitata]